MNKDEKWTDLDDLISFGIAALLICAGIGLGYTLRYLEKKLAEWEDVPHRRYSEVFHAIEDDLTRRGLPNLQSMYIVSNEGIIDLKNSGLHVKKNDVVDLRVEVGDKEKILQTLDYRAGFKERKVKDVSKYCKGSIDLQVAQVESDRNLQRYQIREELWETSRLHM